MKNVALFYRQILLANTIINGDYRFQMKITVALIFSFFNKCCNILLQQNLKMTKNAGGGDALMNKTENNFILFPAKHAYNKFKK